MTLYTFIITPYAVWLLKLFHFFVVVLSQANNIGYFIQARTATGLLKRSSPIWGEWYPTEYSDYRSVRCRISENSTDNTQFLVIINTIIVMYSSIG